MITLSFHIEYINAVRISGSEVPTTEAKCDELVKSLMGTWFASAKNDTGWIRRDNIDMRIFELNLSFKAIFIKKKMG